MAQTVFHFNELKAKDDKFVLGLTKSFEPVVEETVEEEVPEYTGPTADDLHREAEAFKVQWEAEKQKMIDEANAEASEIVQKAQEAAFIEVKHQTDEAQTIKTDAQSKADEIIKSAQDEAARILDEAAKKKEQIFQETHDSAAEEGRKTGYEEGKAEVERLVERLHIILESVMAKRQQIFDETEQQIVELVLLMARKVVKVLSENQRSVVMANIVQALRKVKGRGDVCVRVNMQDARLTTDHIKDFIRQVESIQNMRVMEDSTVDKGGCVVETDFGTIDARISSQLSELERKILEVSPIKTVQVSASD